MVSDLLIKPAHDDGLLAEWLDESMEAGACAAERGRVSTQIPALSEVASTHFGMAVATTDGQLVHAGDSARPFSIQSLSKLFALCALLEHDPRAWTHVGWNPTNAQFNSVAELERSGGRPANPFVNAGALVVTDLLLERSGDAVAATLDIVRRGAFGRPVVVDQDVAMAEMITDHRNSALAHVLAEHGRLKCEIERLLAQYCQQCAIAADVQTVAAASLFLADRATTSTDLAPATVRRINAVLLTSGMYGAAGDIAYRIGLPAKSGIGGGVVAVMPGRGTVCVWSPPLDSDGNSAGGVAAIERFAELAGWSVF
ncbi:glutaminase [Gordonia namibiensis NBRC 108229]|uniref:Glutaminase n=1 Tax=Gordonia namibiensis NBRC 108229 TaxID=1208314 RepID=K6X4H2_9ACTN|nr:glutaminase A [Gordonia namibiensis]GAC00972.1 glutaminase [Gordonia namibiensis NBRC 108229]